jgi:uncharacterized protein YbjT (DUF2867 family)
MGTQALCADSTRNIVSAMKDSGVRRLVCVTAMGAGNSRPFVTRFAKWMMKNPLADKTAQEVIVRESELEFVIVRPSGLSDEPAKGSAAVAVVDSAKKPVPHEEISRADLAAFVLDQCAGDAFLGMAPGLSWKPPSAPP